MKRRGDALLLDPQPRADWKEFKVQYRYGASTYKLMFLRKRATGSGHTLNEMVSPVRKLGSPLTLILDDAESWEGNRLPLIDDGQPHDVKILF